jgi:alkanesulfonate monooxygenase SsuD/methylene tetrahydromethanopterin reductase-like flavin-dependent oxidoreductase (luciferase family)
LEEATAIYRRDFKPSGGVAKPHFMLAVNVFAAETDAEGAFLRSSMQQAFARLRSGMPGKLPRPVTDIDAAIGPAMRAGVDHALRISAVGSAATVKAQLTGFIDAYQPDELILTGQIHDHSARMRSFEIAAEVLHDLG